MSINPFDNENGSFRVLYGGAHRAVRLNFFYEIRPDIRPEISRERL